ncbi:MAG TPA: methyltransferase domain-containing protein [Candidatus Binataceae bacterium]|nr:methyltransferase domain-containing protein [Candidatus Binataceae bacterium]
MSNWYDDNSFWETFQDYMFDPARIELARTEVDKLVALLKLDRGARVLDLCCGIGRHSIEFARRGFSVTSVDRTKLYLEQAQASAAKEGLQIEFVQSDMREFSRREAFDGAINLFTSFGFFDDAADDLRVARNVCESLRVGGKFIVDINGKEIIAGKFRERDWNHRDDGTIVMEERRVIDGWTRIESRWIHLRGTERRESKVVVRLYSGAELVALMKQAGFQHVETYGSLAATSYDNHAERLVAVATK